ncbi:DNA topoisomerase 2-alpha-like isoform X2 [Tubulanus polymorphus]|uniref:DNA topoisomerase 2-alpha-like isoform X2 n=1 Tax=Tubulanus polymorphus TaxID=672921 RepID=UPI003DA4067A
MASTNGDGSITSMFAKKTTKENSEVVHATDGSKKRLSVERIYQKKSQLEHILLRPDSYIGSVETVTQAMWTMDSETNTMVQREVTFVPGLYKIFDEILVNSADNKQRDPKMNCIKIDIVPDECKIKIWNNGKGIPVVMHKTENMYVPSMIFGHLLTSSNYDDTQKKVTGGRNGFGAKLCNIFSTKFIVETSSGEYHKSFKQTWTTNMTKTTEPKINDAKADDFTCVTFYPDLAKFKMDTLNRDIVDIFTRRAYDIAAASKGVKVFLNGKKLPIKGFKDYVDLFVKDKVDENNEPLKVVYEEVSPRWEVAVTMSEKGFQQCSFVNSIATTKGGRHVDYVADQVVTKLIEVVKKKGGKGNINIKPFQVKSHMWVFVNCLIENPTFDSQTKENMTLQAKSFGSKCALSDKFINAANKCGIVESIMQWMRFKAQAQMNKKLSSSKHSKLKGVPKLDDANDAGTKNSTACTLILTEGDSAKTLAVAGLSVIGRDRYGVFPLKGKVLNVRDATHKQIMENAEITNLIKILGLQYKHKYDSPESLKTLRYGKLMIMTDQDQDGSHIKGLLINFIHHNWPGLLKQPFLEEFITPIVKASKGREERSFYSLPEFEEWKDETDNWFSYKIKYYKGLGTSTSKEAKEYFTNMERHRIKFRYTGPEDDSCIELAFSKKKADDRKQWLTNWMEERKRRNELGLPEVYLYGKQTKQITYNEFVNRELILFSNLDNERSIPCMVDGLKPGQRKVLYTCLKRNDKREVKVAQLAGSVAEMSAYHHGEAALMGTIINLAQNFIGSNNINLLQPIGQFGTRLHGGKDAASPRYIFTQLGKATKLLFNSFDDPMYKYNFDDNVRIEPVYYVPIIPMALVNGAEGIGTGWSTKMPNYNQREIVDNLLRMMDGEEPQYMKPWYKNFKGDIDEIEEGKYVFSGEISIIDDTTVEITELPVKTWIQNYKESVLEPMLQGSEKVPVQITDYKEYHTDVTVRFVVKLTPEKLREAEAFGLHKFFKLQSQMSFSSVVLFDSNGCIRRYNNAEEILKEFYGVRLDYYERRKVYLEGMLAAESLRLDNQARFIVEKIDGKISIENKPKKELVQMLVRGGYDSDPVKSWKEAQNKLQAIEENQNIEDEQEEKESGPDYNYILGMALWSLSREKKEELLKQKDAKADELAKLRRKTPKDLWKDDLANFRDELDKIEEKEREDDLMAVNALSKATAGKGRKLGGKLGLSVQCKPSPHGIRVAPAIDILKKKESATGRGRKKKDDPLQQKLLDFLDNEGEDDNMKPLAERIGMSPEKYEAKENAAKSKKPAAATKEKKPRAPKKAKAAGVSEVANKNKEDLAGSPKKSPKKGKKRRNPWSDESDDSNADDDIDDDDDDERPVIPRDTNVRRAAASKIKYNFDDDEDDDDNGDDDDDDDFIDNDGIKESQATTEDNGANDAISDDDLFPSRNGTHDDGGGGDAAMVIEDSDDDFGLRKDESVNKPVTFDDIISKQPAAKSTKTTSKTSEPPKKRKLGKVGKGQQSLKTMFGAPEPDDGDGDDIDVVPDSQPNADSLFSTDLPSNDKDKAAKKPRAKKVAEPKKPRKKKADSDESPKPKKPAKKKKVISDSEEDDDEEDYAPKKSKKRAAAVSSDDEDEDFAAAAAAAPSRAGGRARKAVRYTISEDDDDDLY